MHGRSTDEERLFLKKDGTYAGWIYLVYGNDGYVISDYTTNLDEETWSNAEKSFQ